MPEHPLSPSLPAAPDLRPPRPPPPGPAVWLAFLFGPPVLTTLGCVLLQLQTAPQRELDSGMAVAAGIGLGFGLLLGACGVGGLALATRLFRTPGGRVLGGIALAGALLVGLAGVAFAGCMCVAISSSNR